jgi:hypothetical protein
LNEKDRRPVPKETNFMSLAAVREQNNTGLSKPSASVMLALLVMLACAMLLDTFATQAMVTRGIVSEGNPAMAALVASGRFVAFKVAGALICAGLIWAVYRRFPCLALLSAMGSLLITSVVLLWNASVISGLT